MSSSSSSSSTILRAPIWVCECVEQFGAAALIILFALQAMCVCKQKSTLVFNLPPAIVFHLPSWAELRWAPPLPLLLIVVVFVVVVFVSSCSPPPPVPVCSQFMLIKQFTVWYPTFSASPSSGGEHYGLTSISHHQSDTNRPSFSAGISAVPGNNVAKRRERHASVIYMDRLLALFFFFFFCWYWACTAQCKAER